MEWRRGGRGRERERRTKGRGGEENGERKVLRKTNGGGKKDHGGS